MHARPFDLPNQTSGKFPFYKEVFCLNAHKLNGFCIIRGCNFYFLDNSFMYSKLLQAKYPSIMLNLFLYMNQLTQIF